MKLTRKIEKVQDDLREKVQREYRYEIQIAVREEPGPFGLKVIVACNPKAHPGTGMKKVLMDEAGTTYGTHGEKDLADLIRQKGWLSNPPEPTSFLKLLNLAYFDGIGKLAPEVKFVKTHQGWEFHFIKIEHPSGKRISMVMTIGSIGSVVFGNKGQSA
ncbi:MAG: hypothetical protein HY073_01180, partial [Deltaproteobacteria bacterium]|nr:hypothetical protein [Deltaproteobacteria bacterium]